MTAYKRGTKRKKKTWFLHWAPAELRIKSSYFEHLEGLGTVTYWMTAKCCQRLRKRRVFQGSRQHGWVSGLYRQSNYSFFFFFFHLLNEQAGVPGPACQQSFCGPQPRSWGSGCSLGPMRTSLLSDSWTIRETSKTICSSKWKPWDSNPHSQRCPSRNIRAAVLISNSRLMSKLRPRKGE